MTCSRSIIDVDVKEINVGIALESDRLGSGLRTSCFHEKTAFVKCYSHPPFVRLLEIKTKTMLPCALSMGRL